MSRRLEELRDLVESGQVEGDRLARYLEELEDLEAPQGAQEETDDGER